MKTRERPPVVLDSNHTAQITQKHHTTAQTHWWCSELHSAICRNTNGRLQTVNNTFNSVYSHYTVKRQFDSLWRPCWSVREFGSAACWRSSRRCRLSPRRRPARVGLSWNARCCSSPAPPGGHTEERQLPFSFYDNLEEAGISSELDYASDKRTEVHPVVLLDICASQSSTSQILFYFDFKI